VGGMQFHFENYFNEYYVKMTSKKIRKDPSNKVTEHDKAKDPISWVQRMNNFQSKIHETIYADLIFS